MMHLIKTSHTLTKSWLGSKNCNNILKSCHSTIPLSPPQLLSHPTAYSRLPNRRLLAISGPDSTRYLQGAITANVNTNTTTGFYAAFLNAQGRVLNDVFIYPFKEEEGKYRGQQGWLVEVDTKQVESLAKRIKRYKLNSKFEVRVLPETERGIWSIWDETNEKICPGYLQNRIGCIDQRAPGMGLRLLLPGDKEPELDMEVSHHDCYRLRRYLKGVPEGQDELIPEQAFPQESNIDLMGGIDYRKGCYVGQELTIRTHHTGVVRKRILPLQLYDLDQEPPPQALAYDSNQIFGAEKIPIETNIIPWEKSGRSAGKWLSGIGNIGLGLCRLAAMTNLESDGVAHQPDKEFRMEWTSEEGLKTVKVKAIPAPWWPLKQQNL